MMRPIRHCLRCGEPLPAEFRRDATFHLPCKNYWNKSRAIAQTSDPYQGCAGTHRARIELRLLVSLCHRHERSALDLPRPGRKTLRFDFWERQTPGFAIKPFEPPVVPVKGQYELLYFDEQGNRLNAPVGKALVMLEPRVKVPSDQTGCPLLQA